MDTKKVNKFSQRDLREVESYVWEAMDRQRGRIQFEAPTSYFVSICALALMTQEVSGKQALLNYGEGKFVDEITLSFLQRVHGEFGQEIDDLSNRFSAEILRAAALLSRPSRLAEVNESSTPEGVSKLAASLLELNNNDTILDLGSGVGSFLLQAAQSSGSAKLYGVEINNTSVLIANIRSLILNYPLTIVRGNALSQDFTGLLANKVFIDPPLGSRLSALQDFVKKNPKLDRHFVDAKKTISGDWVYSIAAYLNMKKPGKTVALMTNAGSWNKPDQDIRRKLVNEGIVEGVILLPERLLSTTMIAITMMVFSQNNKEIKMVDASGMYTSGRRQNSLELTDVQKILDAYYSDGKTASSKKVTINDVADQEYILNPQRYIDSSPVANGITLGEISLTINRGAMINSNELDELASNEESNYRYLMLQNIQNGMVDSKLPFLKKFDGKWKRYCLEDGNLIISKISPFKVAIMKVKHDEQVLANGNLYFLRLDKNKVNPVYVNVFLQSEAGMAQLNRLAKGAAIRSISMQDLKMIKIPYLPRHKQDDIAKEYESLHEELLILERQKEIVQDKIDKLFEGVV